MALASSKPTLIWFDTQGTYLMFILNQILTESQPNRHKF